MRKGKVLQQSNIDDHQTSNRQTHDLTEQQQNQQMIPKNTITEDE